MMLTVLLLAEVQSLFEEVFNLTIYHLYPEAKHH